MEFLIDLKYVDDGYNAIVHMVIIFKAMDEIDAGLCYNELEAAFVRRGVKLLPSSYSRIDNDQALRERAREYHEFHLSRATANIEIEQFYLEGPDQAKSLWDNLAEKLFTGENAIANVGKKYNIPVRLIDKQTRNPINNEIYYFSVEHLIPK